MLHDTAWLALDVHRRGDGAQTRLLASLAPTLHALERAGRLRAAWGTRFDARGPHLFLLLGAAPERGAEVASAVADALHAHLAAHPPETVLAPEELLARHEACRGKALSAADRLPGLAGDDSWTLEPHPADGYPLHLAEGMADGGAAWLAAATKLFHWAAARAAAGEGTAGALALAAALDAELAGRGLAEAAWRHHATTLLPALAARLASAEQEVAASLERAVTPKNRAAFDAAWAAHPDPAAATLAAALAAAALAPDGRGPAARVAALREAVHCTLLVLGLPVAAHVPLVLYAWRRHLAGAES